MHKNPDSAQIRPESDPELKFLSLEEENEFLKQRIEESARQLEEYKKIEEKWVLFMKSASESFSIYDSELNMIEINETGLNMFPEGTTRRDIIGKNISDLIPDVRRGSPIYRKFINVLKTGRPHTIIGFVPDNKFGEDVHVNVTAFRVGDGLGIILTVITELKNALILAEKREAELEKKQKDLEETNIALKVLLKQREQDKEDLEENLVFSIKELIVPYLHKLKRAGSVEKKEEYLEIIELSLDDIISPFTHRLSSKYLKLTSCEIQVANLIKQGKTTKEIAEILNASPRSVDFHRGNLRKKFNLQNKKTNLRTYLLSLSE